MVDSRSGPSVVLVHGGFAVRREFGPVTESDMATDVILTARTA